IATLRERAMPFGLVNAGGDLAVFGSRMEAVHVRNPRDPGHAFFLIDIKNQALASSGPRFDPDGSVDPNGAAIIDPRSRSRAGGIIAATVRAPACMIADALTKVVMIQGPAAAGLLDHYGASALAVLADGSLTMSPDFRSAVRLAA